MDDSVPTMATAAHSPKVAANPVDAILRVIREGERFLVCSHSRPDGDAVGSVLAMGMLLEQIGKRADLVTADRIPLVYRNLPGAGAIPHRTARTRPLRRRDSAGVRQLRADPPARAGELHDRQHRSPCQRPRVGTSQLDRSPRRQRGRTRLPADQGRRGDHHAGDGDLPLHDPADRYRRLHLRRRAGLDIRSGRRADAGRRRTPSALPRTSTFVRPRRSCCCWAPRSTICIARDAWPGCG